MSFIPNIFGKDGFFWWLGVVEDRNDPLKVGRCRVRILGYHTNNKEVLPTPDLPWALPMMPMTSASVSGVGQTPLGPVPGSWVIGFFVDGKDKQQPMMLGTISGYPEEGCAHEETDLTNVVMDSNGNVVKDEDGYNIYLPSVDANISIIEEAEPPTDTPVEAEQIFPPLTAYDIRLLMQNIASFESSSTPTQNNYSARNFLGFRGKYQFGAGALISLNYMISPVGRGYTNADMNNSTLWTGKNGINNIDDFLSNKNNCQEIIMVEYLKYNYNLLKENTINSSMTKGQAAGLLWVAHNHGHGGAKLFKRGIVRKDANGTTARQVYAMGRAIFNEDQTIFPVYSRPINSPKANKNQPNPETTPPTETLNDPAIGQPVAYTDPSSIYPRCDYVGRPDTNKLATSDTFGTIVDAKLIMVVDAIERANKVSSWDEPNPAYAARYPFNKVEESESGHITEVDDTPNKERLHWYHRVGTYVEVDENGSYHKHIQGDNFEISIHNKHVYVRGDCDVTVEGAKRTLVKDVLDLEIIGQTTVNIKNTATINVRDAANINVGSSANISVQQDVNLTAVGNINGLASSIKLESTGSLNLKGSTLNLETSGKMSVLANGQLHIKSEDDIYMDGDDIISQQGKTRATSATGSGLSLDISEAQAEAFLANTESANPAPFDDIVRVDADIAAAKATLDDAGEDPEKMKRDISSGIKTLEQYLAGESRINQGCTYSDINPPKIVAPKNYKKGEFASYKEHPYTIQLSKYFTLGDIANCGNQSYQDNLEFWSNTKRVSWMGLTKSQLLDNLRGLAVNVLDPIKERFPNMSLTSCMRFSVPQGGSINSQHLVGQAADIIFGNDSLYEAALWIRDNIAYDQLIMEFSIGTPNTSWLHISFNPNGNRPANAPYKVATFMNGKPIPSKMYLCDLS